MVEHTHMPDFVVALARKYCPQHQVDGSAFVLCSCQRTIAAIREALEEAGKIAQEIGSRSEDIYYDDPNVPWQTVALNIAAAIAALRERE